MITQPNRGNRLICSLPYDDAPAAIQWLEEAFGFTAHMVIQGEDGKVMHSQLKSPDGDSMVMVYSTREDEQIGSQRPPVKLGGSSGSLYMVEDDVDQHHARAVAAGAKILMPPTAQEYGGSCYTCTDPEGHIWSFGSYDPWAPAPAE
ncbi:MAG: putative glyoxalase superfamily protein PhnB [Candidatus Paceibacteria bacterium]|jgi:uncharacterized glyoxalase superfamily protein PhnB